MFFENHTVLGSMDDIKRTRRIPPLSCLERVLSLFLLPSPLSRYLSPPTKGDGAVS